MFEMVGVHLPEGGVFAIYGPFNYGGHFTSDSNRAFDAWLRQRDTRSGLRDFEAIVALADSERLNEMFSHLLAELRLAFGLLRDPHFLHAPYVGMNLKILQIFEAGRPAEAAQELSAYLVHSERIILAAYARRLAEAGIKAP